VRGGGGVQREDDDAGSLLDMLTRAETTNGEGP
jgi:hypothetical protein